ncbi:VOC family protein [Amycolatopsis jejuensis]|uniref:VOC family protein n=1 Tax=Amycolatopsis jejuensis TaxID=330084 RepID=UPI000524C90A|nr:VOC family protein [Amycolatopsis jejuensis]
MADEVPTQTVYPNLKYRDPKAAIAFLTGAFGFSTHFVVETADGTVEHAQLRVGTQLIFLGREQPDDRYGMHSPLALAGTSAAFCVWVPDDSLDEHERRAKDHGARILSPVHGSLAGVREYSCADPENHVWTFSSYSGE